MTCFTGFEEDPIAERKSHIYGIVRLYAPLGPVADWPELPFLLETETGDWKVRSRKAQRINPDTLVMEEKTFSVGQAVENRTGKGIKLLVRPDRVWTAFAHLSLLSMQDLWEDVEAEVMAAL